MPSELYGPLMTVLTLVAVLQMNMKTSKTSLEEATLIETALTTCFGYWAAFSFVIYAAVYICSSYINTIQVRQNILTGFGPWIPESYIIFSDCIAGWLRNLQSRVGLIPLRILPLWSWSLYAFLVYFLWSICTQNRFCFSIKDRR